MRHVYLFTLAILAACGTSVSSGATSTSGGSGGMGSSTTSSSGGGGGVGTDCDACMCCACEFVKLEGGCSEICHMGLDGGTMNAGFCEGAPASKECALCIAQSCGQSDPTSCD